MARIWEPVMNFQGKTVKNTYCVFGLCEALRLTKCVKCGKSVQKGEPICYFWSIRRSVCVDCASKELEEAREKVESAVKNGRKWVEYRRMLDDI